MQLAAAIATALTLARNDMTDSPCCLGPTRLGRTPAYRGTQLRAGITGRKSAESGASEERSRSASGGHELAPHGTPCGRLGARGIGAGWRGMVEPQLVLKQAATAGSGRASKWRRASAGSGP